MIEKLIRIAFKLFYNRFAFTYDLVAALVSRGDWENWTRAAIHYARGPKLLEIAFGTGSLHLSLWQAGFAPFGVELSSYMINIARGKLERNGIVPTLIQGRAQELPFSSGYFDSVIFTFPAPFVLQPETLEEVRRVMKTEGQLIWVDGGRLNPAEIWNRFLNWALDIASSGSHAGWPDLERFANCFTWRTERVTLAHSSVTVLIASPILDTHDP